MEDGRKIPSETVVSEQQISDSFLCCICLDLLYKPIVLACGHISCFWCIHGSMNILDKSHCPICRQSYNHFPAICQMLHFLLLKMYPVAYRQREIQILDEERKMGYFSPQIKAHPNSSHIHEETDVTFDSTPSVTKISQSCMSRDSCSYEAKISDQIMQASASELHESELAVMGDTSAAHSKANKAGLAEEMILPSDKVYASAYQVSVDDALCNACKQLLLQPVVLNCGHAYCQTCIGMPNDDVLTCQVCERIHPHGFPKVCLELDHFFEEQFPKEYALRRDASQIIDVHFQNASSTTGYGRHQSLDRSRGMVPGDRRRR
ncbi:hypothetical protein RJ641_031162 [Dillenia turbinata]|uniref:RING-type domain-containing protein n=1 Tax=Dillenia turbinata TaxID=194707 RepID=A0AAN8VTR9_9MAGN